MSREIPRWYVVGLGRVGLPLAVGLARQGALAGAWCRSAERARTASARLSVQVDASDLPSPAGADVVLVALPDDVIARLVAALPDPLLGSDSTCWLHTSGALVGDTLANAGARGPCGSVHPLQSFTGAPDDLERLAGAFFAVEGDPVALEHARWLVGCLGGRAHELPRDAKLAYHAAATVASNGVYALLHLAEQICERAGVGSRELGAGLARLALGSADNAARAPLDSAATGPVVRGDAHTVARHLGWFATNLPSEHRLYVELAEHLLVLARRGERAPERALLAVETVLSGPVDS